MKTKKLFVVILALLIMAESLVIVSAQTFTDVPEDHPYKVAIDFCETNGFIKGTSATTFEPNSRLTRAQLATMWCRTLEMKDDNPNFKDITILQNYYDSPIIVLYSLGHLSGTSDDSFSPNDFITREQLALLTMRTYELGVADEDAYTQYADYESISEWARDGISSCINAEVFEGLYDGENFLPNKPVTRAEVCKLIYNLSTEAHTITIGDFEGGTVTANTTDARPGTPIFLTVTPDEGKQLVEGSLKYDDTVIENYSFAMPSKDITITAEFEDKPEPTLESIDVTSLPETTLYTVGDTLDLTGLVITATYSDGSTEQVTGYTTTPDDGNTLETEGTVTITVSYSEDEITQLATFDVEVAEAEEPEVPEETEEPEVPEEPGEPEEPEVPEETEAPEGIA